ncbi:hypothetical protein PR202_gb24459 [Eleusine coracana subsp. coracana]|uniref:Uncharacterized protein n=1 Tax=Eleusine coracana subsp. coracana TaxID=191504 RepID=A0AAV5FIS1_ELECO|nr:hypothetical protein PR202_gb24459 [Eleusine coracana subsp. coracana]
MDQLAGRAKERLGEGPVHKERLHGEPGPPAEGIQGPAAAAEQCSEEAGHPNHTVR